MSVEQARAELLDAARRWACLEETESLAVSGVVSSAASSSSTSVRSEGLLGALGDRIRASESSEDGHPLWAVVRGLLELIPQQNTASFGSDRQGSVSSPLSLTP